MNVKIDNLTQSGTLALLSMTGQQDAHEFDSAHIKSRNFGCALRLRWSCPVNVRYRDAGSLLTGRAGVFFYRESRVTSGNRIDEPQVKEWRGHGQPSPLIGCVSSHNGKSAGCNTGPREKPSVGSGDHCARVFKAKRFDREVISPSANHLPVMVGDGLLTHLPQGYAT